MKHILNSIIIPAAVILLAVNAIAGTEKIRVVDNAALKAAYGAYTTSQITKKTNKVDYNLLMKIGNIEGNLYMVDTITELAYLDFITPV